MSPGEISKKIKEIMKEEEKLEQKIQEAIEQELKVFQRYVELMDYLQPDYLRKYISASLQYRSYLIQYYKRLSNVMSLFNQLIDVIEEKERELMNELKKIEPELKKIYEAEEKELTELVKIEKASEKEIQDRLKKTEKKARDLLELQKKLAQELHKEQMKGRGKENKKVNELIQRLQSAAREYQEITRQIDQIKKGKLLIPITLQGQEDDIRRKYAAEAYAIRERVHALETEFHNILIELFHELSMRLARSLHPMPINEFIATLHSMGCNEEIIAKIMNRESSFHE